MPKNDNLVAGITIGAIFAFAVVAMILAVSYGPYAHKPLSNSTLSYITVTATGSVSAVPSQSVIYIMANGTAHSAANATAKLSQTITSIDSALSGYLSGNGSSIQTTSYNLYRPYNSSAYTASEGITVTLPVNYTSAGITALSVVNGTYITGVNIQLSKSQVAGLGSTALAIAMQNATTQAQEVAGPRTPLTISSISINSNGYFYPAPGLALGANLVKVFPGTQSVTQSVTVKYQYGS